MKSWQAIFAVHKRNIKLLKRHKPLLIQPLVIPLVVLFLMVAVFGAGGDDWPIALVDHSNSREAEQFKEALRDSSSNISPYYEIVETNVDQAKEKVQNGRLHLLIELPENFSKTKTVEITTFNITSDAMKNVRLRLEHTVNQHMESQGELSVVSRQVTEQTQDVWRSAYYGGSSILLTLFLGSMLFAANLYAFERENRTRKEMLLTPNGPIHAGLGIIMTSVSVSILISFISLVLSVGFLHFEFHLKSIVLVYLAILPVLIGCAGAGIFLACLLKYYRVIQPVIILIALGTYLIGGGFASVSMLMPVARTIANVWLPSRIFEWFNPLMHHFVSNLSLGQYFGMLGAGFLGLLLVMLSYRLELRQAIGGGQ